MQEHKSLKSVLRRLRHSYTHLGEFENGKRSHGIAGKHAAQHRIDLCIETCVSKAQQQRTEQRNPCERRIKEANFLCIFNCKAKRKLLCEKGSKLPKLTWGIVGQVQVDEHKTNQMNDESDDDNRIPAKFDGFWSKQAKQYTAEYLTDADANARQADQLFGWLSHFQCEPDARTVDAAIKWQLETYAWNVGRITRQMSIWFALPV